MQIPNDHIVLMRSLGAYSYASTTDPEVQTKLQSLQSTVVDRIFDATEILYAFRDRIGADGLSLLGQLTGFAGAQRWDTPAEPGRLANIYARVLHDVEAQPLAVDFKDPAPVTAYRTDGADWRNNQTPDLAKLKAAKRTAVNDLRDQKQDGPAPTPFGLVDNDDSSKIKINGAVTMAMLALQQNAAFSVDWTMHDNSIVTLDQIKMLQMGEAAGAYVSELHARATALKAQIDAITVANGDDAAAVTALEAIDITAGWPSISTTNP